ncbi:AP-3 complex subunit beta [Allomyces javanicus]|nr:AP-3 complex subunit beta [Allomyces javanicus]
MDRARELTLPASVARAAALVGRDQSPGPERTVTLLDSKFDVEKLEGLKNVLQLVHHGEDATEYFAAVVKNAIHPNVEIRRLVYAYVAVYAPRNPELALLAINALQRDLADPNFTTRVLSLRTLASIHVATVVPLIVSALYTATKDISPHVRATAASSLAQVAPLLDEDVLTDLAGVLLGDRDANVVGATVAVLDQWPGKQDRDRLAVLHPHYRALVQKMGAMNDSVLPGVLQILLRYVKAFMAPPSTLMLAGNSDVARKSPDAKDADTPDPDLEQFWQAVALLISSASAAAGSPVVQYWCARALMETAPPTYRAPTVQALHTLLEHPPHQHAALHLVHQYVQHRPDEWRVHAARFLAQATDAPVVARLKLAILAQIADPTTPMGAWTVAELRHALYATESRFAAAVVAHLARDHRWRPLVHPVVLDLLAHPNPRVVAEAVAAVRALLMDPGTDAAHRVRLLRAVVRMEPAATHSTARVTIAYLMAQHLDAPLVQAALPDVLRMRAKSFPKDQEVVKLATLALAVKALAVGTTTPAAAESPVNGAVPDAAKPDSAAPPTAPSPAPAALHPSVAPLVEYIATLARYDASVDVRDAARHLRRIATSRHLARTARDLVFGPPPLPTESAPAQPTRLDVPGTRATAAAAATAAVLGPWRPVEVVPASTRTPLPASPAVGTGSAAGRIAPVTVRNVPLATTAAVSVVTAGVQRPPGPVVAVPVRPVGAAKVGGKPKQTLDEFFDESSSEEEEEEEEEDSGAADDAEAEWQRQLEKMMLQEQEDGDEEGGATANGGGGEDDDEEEEEGSDDEESSEDDEDEPTLPGFATHPVFGTRSQVQSPVAPDLQVPGHNVWQ